ncbi:MAG: serine protease [Treponema sp.]|jgi:serine protease Do|nr:serine protease [Treponema sp.]
MRRRIFLAAAIISVSGLFCFGQTESLRDYVGLINQTFHPDIVAYLGKSKADFERRGNADAAKSIDDYLKGGSGTGFVYVAPNGANYVITNHHVITQSYDISVTFEKQDGGKITYGGLTIIAADEEMDIALLAFRGGGGGGGEPYPKGLTFLDRPVAEGEDVFSAGFPGLGAVTLWQFGRGMVSNVRVEFPVNDDTTTGRIMGPYIQHTAQVDPGNSGGPLLVRDEGVPTGYAVAGINTLSARFRQAANFSIPVDRVNAFLSSALGPRPEDERPRLDARVGAFTEGLGESRAVYEHIAKYLSNACIGENAEYALVETLRKANRTVQDDIIRAFVHSPVEGMGYAVAWTIENALRTRPGRISVTVDSTAPNNKNGFTVVFNVNGSTISSDWVNDYGIWRISAFGDFAAGNKTLVEERDRAERDAKRLITDYSFQFSAGLAVVLETGPAFGADFKFRTGITGYGLKVYTGGKEFFQGETTAGLYFPVRMKKAALTPYADFGLGIAVKEPAPRTPNPYDPLPEKDMGFAVSIKGGLMFTTSAVPGLFLQAAYQHNFYIGDIKGIKPGLLFFSLGYGF